MRQPSQATTTPDVAVLTYLNPENWHEFGTHRTPLSQDACSATLGLSLAPGCAGSPTWTPRRAGPLLR
jgi:hypothetical protein